MKGFVYTMVLSMLLFLLLLSFDEKRYQNDPSESDLIATTFEQNLTQNRPDNIETPIQMNEQEQIQEAQQFHTTVWGLFISTIQSGIEWIKQKILKVYNQIIQYAKQSAYQIGCDIAELIYPTRKKNVQKNDMVVVQLAETKHNPHISSDKKDTKEHYIIPSNIVQNR